MTFIWPELLFTLLLIPVFVGLYLRLRRRQTRAAADLGPLGTTQDSGRRGVWIRRHLPPALILIGLSFLLFGLARPEMQVVLPRIEGTVILAFDVSNSMAADDLEPTRVEASKAAARAFVENQPPTVRIGVVAFGGTGLVVQPPTDDQAAILAAIDRLSTQGGTSLGQGIFTSLNAIAGKALALETVTLEEDVEALRIEDYSSAIVVLLTDGENTDEPNPLDIAQLAAEAGVRVYPIGIGSREGVVMEVEGFNILTQLDESLLQQIASITNGEYFRAEDEEALAAVYEDVDLQLTRRGEEMEVTSLAAGVSAVLFLIAGTLSLSWFGRVP